LFPIKETSTFTLKLQAGRMEKKFEVEFLPDAVEFMDTLDPKSQEKIYYNIRKAQVINDSELFKKLTTNIWEFRTVYNQSHYRLFAFWDKRAGKRQWSWQLTG
jgi:hypothetical protein